MTITNPLFTNAMMKNGVTPTVGNALSPAPTAPVVTPQALQNHHSRLHDYQEELKQLLRTPDEELSMSKVFGLASDMITKHKLTNGKHGASAMEIAKELSSPDMPRGTPDGEPPQAADIRKFLRNHFNRVAETQAKLTSKFGPMQQGQ